MLHKNAPQAIKKLKSLLAELQEHPRTGTGQVELLKHYKEETWSRRINKEHRLVYRIHEDVVEVCGIIYLWTLYLIPFYEESGTG